MYYLGLHISEFVFLFIFYSIYKRVCLKKTIQGLFVHWLFIDLALLI